MINTAMTVIEWMYRGSDFTIPISIIDEDGDPVVLAATDEVHFRLYCDNTQAEPALVDMEASLYYRDIGLAIFTLEPDDTKDLLARSYDFTIHVKDEDGNIYPVLSSKLGIVPFNTPVEVV